MKRLTLTAIAIISIIILCSSKPIRVACVDEGGKPYPARLQALLGSDFEVRGCNMDDAKTWLPDIVTIMCSSKDAQGADLEQEYLKVIDEFRGLASKPSIYLCTVTDEVLPVVKKLAARRWLEMVDSRSNPDGMAQEIYNMLLRNGETTPGKRVLFIGDSITDGDWGKADGKPCITRNVYDLNHYLGHGFAANIGIYYLDKYPQRHYKFYNRGIGGGRLEGVQQRWDADVMAVRPDVVSILIGVNDSWLIKDTDYVFDYAAWEARYRDVIERTLAVNPDTRFVLCPPFLEPIFFGGMTEVYRMRMECVRKLAQIVRRLAREYDAVLVPFDTCMDTLFEKDKDTDVRRWTWDGIHPTYAAHARLAKLWRKEAGKLLK